MGKFSSPANVTACWVVYLNFLEMSKTREVLLVGEGNFSFSAALSENAGDDVGVTATCFQSENQTYRQQGAVLNIQRLRDRGLSLGYSSFC